MSLKDCKSVYLVSLPQPFADLVANGVSDVINLTYPKYYLGKVIIYASANNHYLNKECPTEAQRIVLGNRKFKFKQKCIIGEVDIIDCVENHNSIWAEPKKYHWIVNNPVVYKKEIPFKTRGGIQKLTEELLTKIITNGN